MATLLIDANLDGQAERLRTRLQSDAWRELYDLLGLQFLQLEDVGLSRTAKDDVVWRLCQDHGYYLLTANRNKKSDDSLQATILREGTQASLPVFTLADAQRLLRSSTYLEKVIEKLLDYLLDRDNYRGTGRLFLP